MNTLPLLSIIIPCYNVQHYVQAALQSIIDTISPEHCSQIELLIVNDGSTDQTLEIIKNFLPTFNQNQMRYHLIEQDNAGLSAARNVGMAQAKGDYWLFLDSDDILINQALDKLLHAIRQQQPDIIEFDALKFDEHHWENKGLYAQYFADIVTLSPHTDAQNLRVFEENRWYAWSRCYRRELFYHQKFVVGKLFEDMMTIPYLYFAAQTIFRLPEPLIGYRQRAGSILATLSHRHLQDLFTGICQAITAERDYPNHLNELTILQRKNWRLLIAESIKRFLKTRDFSYLTAVQHYRAHTRQTFGRDEGWQWAYFSRIIAQRLFNKNRIKK